MWHNRSTEHAGWTMHIEWVSLVPRPSHCMKEEGGRSGNETRKVWERG